MARRKNGINRRNETRGSRNLAAGRNLRGEIVLTNAGILFTLLTAVLAGVDLLGALVTQLGEMRWGAAAAQALFSIIIAALLYGAFVYLVTRRAYYLRLSNHLPPAASQLAKFWQQSAPELTILIPSYMEETDTVTQTLLSAALQDYPNRRVVLLIDDPPEPADREAKQRLLRTRALPGVVASLLAPARLKMADALHAFEQRAAGGVFDRGEELRLLAAAYACAADWFAEQYKHYHRPDHVSRFFSDQVLAAHRSRLVERKTELLERAEQILTGDETGLGELAPEFFRYEYRRLDTLFDVAISSFERKQFINLSHEPNKAMNLNAYIGLMGGRYTTKQTAAGLSLESTASTDGAIEIPDTDYLLTLDADSILLPNYATRLLEVAESEGNERLAVVQTPYNAFPDAPGRLERIAGATTDIQHIIHQGFTASSATFWVGANALLRKAALMDIATSQTERGFDVPVFIQDRTVIEDTESTVDLIARGWQLYNYPEKLAYSATPPDFGALVIQRRRWANGGLIILPKLLRYLWRSRQRPRLAGEAAQRIHYLASITTVNLGLLIIMAFPLTAGTPSLWLPATVVAYFGLLGRDLRNSGYRFTDLLSFYALTLALIPVNLGGVLKSLQQCVTGQKIPFGRTPKVGQRTAAPAIYILVIWALVAHWLWQGLVDIEAGRWFHAAFVLGNAALLTYGYSAFIGFSTGLQDILTSLKSAGGRRSAGSVGSLATDPADR